MIVWNTVCMGLVALYLFISSRFGNGEIGGFFFFTVIFLFVFCTFCMGLSGNAYDWARYKNSWGRNFIAALKNHVMHIIVFYLVSVFLSACIMILIPFYFHGKSYIGVFLGTMLFWVVLFLTVSMQYYLPLCHITHDGPLTVMKKCFALVLDNKLYSLFVSVKTVFDFMLSALSFFLFPGISFICLTHADSVKLLLLRYDWAREHCVRTKDVNVEEMLEEEKQNIGPRSLKGLFFPWKDMKNGR